MSIPVVDLNAYSRPRDKVEFIKVFGDAIREYGFCRVVGHDVSSKITAPAYAAAKQFFSLPDATKRKYLVKGGAGQRGYTPRLVESAKDREIPDLKEFWHVGREIDWENPFSSIYPPNVWPDAEAPDFRRSMLDIFDALEDCAITLLQALGVYMGMPEDIFSSLILNGNSILRALYYPPVNDFKPIPGAVRAAAHEDISFITLLITSSASGLELLDRNGNWLPVDAAPGEIIVDTGDMIQRMTNSYLPATTHRVVNPDDSGKERFSMPFFVHPRPNAVLSVLPNCRGSDFPKPAPDITGIGFLNERLAELGLNKL